MADPANIMKLLQALGGSADYAQGSMSKKNGQPMLQKPAISAPDLMSPYAPGNRGGQPPGYFGNVPYDPRTATRDPLNPTGFEMGGHTPQANGTVAPNRNAKSNQMPDNGAQHPLNQLAQYLATPGGRSASATPHGTDPAMFHRGGPAMRNFMPNSPTAVRG